MPIDLDTQRYKQINLSILAQALSIILSLGLLDYLTGPELSLSIFYLIPIFTATWYAGFWSGVFASLASLLIWVFADFLVRDSYSNLFIVAWNIIVRFGFFLITTNLLSELKSKYELEKNLASTDPLTKIPNRRYFYHVAELEIARLRRKKVPFTLVYIDLDDFKSVNDRFGHLTGDRLLIAVSSVLQNNIRKNDTVARFGGDEFVLLFYDTDDAAATEVISKVRDLLLEKMMEKGWSITFSMGAATFFQPPENVDLMISDVDRLMYLSKQKGKDHVEHVTYHKPIDERDDHASV